MTTRMLINDQRNEQLRVAIIEGPILKDYHLEIADRGLCRGNIYRGVVANIQPSLGAAFIDIGEERHGFLPVADVLPSAYHKKPSEKGRRPPVDQVLQKGRPILVQVTKDGVGQKGAALTTNLALAGRYLVLTPYDDTRGISRKAEDDKARKTIRQRLKKLTLPDGHGVIVRTNGLEQNQTTLNRNLNALLRLWKRVRDAEAEKGRGPRLLYSDQDLTVQALRDFLDSSIAEVLVDSDEVHGKAEAYMRAFMPRSKTRLVRYDDRLPLFSRYRLETQIEHIYERTALLPSGGSLVIDATEALTAIDVNSGRATHADKHDETILTVNVEAAKEVARQLRLRDIGGLVVIDFIDMRTRKHQHKLEKVMRDAMKEDRARNSVGRISPNGLLEINRQRIKQALRLRTHRSCPTCQGVGTIAAPEFAAWNLLRRIEARALTGLFEGVTVALHPEMADALQNRHRNRLAELENELDFEVEIISTPTFKRSEDRFDWRERETAPPPRLDKKTGPALTATDLTLPGHRSVAADSEAADDEATEARGRKRKKAAKPARSKAKAKAKVKAKDGEEAAEEKPAKAKRKAKAKGRKPSRRSKKKVDDVEAQGAESDAPEEKSGDAKPSDAKPSRSRRRRRGGRRRSRKTGEEIAGEPAQGDVQPVETAAEASESARDDESDGTQRTRGGYVRRRPRRRKPAAAAAAEAEPAQGGPAETGPSDFRPTETAHTPVIPDATGDGSDSSKWAAGPSSQLRWQWWGGPEQPASKKRESEPDVPSAEGDG